MAYFYVFCSKNILTILVGYQQPTCVCIKMEFFHVNYIHFRPAVFAHVGCGVGTIVYRKWGFVLHV